MSNEKKYFERQGETSMSTYPDAKQVAEDNKGAKRSALYALIAELGLEVATLENRVDDLEHPLYIYRKHLRKAVVPNYDRYHSSRSEISDEAVLSETLQWIETGHLYEGAAREARETKELVGEKCKYITELAKHLEDALLTIRALAPFVKTAAPAISENLNNELTHGHNPNGYKL